MTLREQLIEAMGETPIEGADFIHQRIAVGLVAIDNIDLFAAAEETAKQRDELLVACEAAYHSWQFDVQREVGFSESRAEKLGVRGLLEAAIAKATTEKARCRDDC